MKYFTETAEFFQWFCYIYIYKTKTNTTMTNKTPILEQIADLYPGESIDVKFPDGFTIEYEKTKLVDDKWVKVIEKSLCTRMNVWYWDDDDHRCKDYYFYNGEDRSWFCKGRSVTKESWQKINAYLRIYDCLTY